MSNAAPVFEPAGLTIGTAARIMREAVKDRAYRATPLGLEVARYIRWKRNEWGARPETIRDYESILARTALYFADLELRDFSPPVGTERLRECWDEYWGDRTGRTRAKVRSVWIDFFEWGVRDRGMHGNPARALAVPKKRDVEIHTFPPTVVEKILGAQTYPADWCAALLILKYGLRRSGIANAQRKHFDHERGLMTVHTKGGRIYLVPVVEDAFWLKLSLLQVEVGWGDDDYLLYRQDTRSLVVPLEEAEEILTWPNEGKRGYAKRTTRNHKKAVSGQSVHRWWYRCLTRAGLIDEGVTSGMNMHRGRHTAITDVLRATHDLKLTQMLAGHKDIASTSRYAHLDSTDLETALRKMRGEE